jgi:uroporphyrinogen-III decarboxylase
MRSAVSEDVLFWKNGDRTVFPWDDLPRHHPAKPPVRPSLDNFDPSSIPEDIDFIPVSQGLEFRIDPDNASQIFDKIVASVGAKYSVHGEVTSPLDYFLNLFGFEEAIVGLAKNPSKSKEVLQRYTDGIIKIATGQADRGVDAIKISSPFSGGGFLSPGYYREFVLAYESQIARAVEARGVRTYLHVCGSVGDRLEIMAESGVSGIECLDPPPLGNVNLSDAKRRIGRRLFIKGNIDPVNVLLRKSLPEVESDAGRKIRQGRPGGGFILSTACSIAPHTPSENVQALARIAEAGR